MKKFRKIYFLPILVFTFLVSTNLVLGAGQGCFASRKEFESLKDYLSTLGICSILYFFAIIFVFIPLFSPLFILFFLLKTKNIKIKVRIDFLIPIFIILQLIFILLFLYLLKK